MQIGFGTAALLGLLTGMTCFCDWSKGRSQSITNGHQICPGGCDDFVAHFLASLGDGEAKHKIAVNQTHLHSTVCSLTSNSQVLTKVPSINKLFERLSASSKPKHQIAILELNSGHFHVLIGADRHSQILTLHGSRDFHQVVDLNELSGKCRSIWKVNDHDSTTRSARLPKLSIRTSPLIRPEIEDEAGGSRQATIHIYNDGKVPVFIGNPKAGCTCADLRFHGNLNYALPPGCHARITATSPVTAFATNKTVWIPITSSENSEEKSIDFQLVAAGATRDLLPVQREIDFGPISFRSELPTRMLELRKSDLNSPEIRGLRLPTWVKMAPNNEPGSIASASSFKLELISRMLSLGENSGYIEIDVNDRIGKPILIPVRAKLGAPITIHPDSIVLPAQSHMQQDVVIQATDPGIEIRHCALTVPDLIMGTASQSNPRQIHIHLGHRAIAVTRSIYCTASAEIGIGEKTFKVNIPIVVQPTDESVITGM